MRKNASNICLCGNRWTIFSARHVRAVNAPADLQRVAAGAKDNSYWTLMSNKETALASERDFFLPDLCTAQAVLFLVLVAALLSIVLELAASGLRLFDGYHFAMTSLFVQPASGTGRMGFAKGCCRLLPGYFTGGVFIECAEPVATQWRF